MIRTMRNRFQPKSRVGRVSCYCLLLVAPELARSQDAGATLTLTPATFQFGSQAVNSTSKAQTATLTNKATTTVTNIAISVMGDFGQTTNCTSSLAPNGSCSINVSFSPTVSGMRSGTLKVTSSTGSPLTSTLSGIGYSLVSISLSPSSPSIAPGTTVQFHATGAYDDGGTRDLSTSAQWSSSATSVATIDSSGNATGVASGSTSITAKLGAISGSTNLMVTSASLLSITIHASKAAIPIGIPEQLSATGKFSDGTSQTITNSVSWASTKPSVLTVNNGGLIFSVGTGTSQITAQLGSITGTKKITVTSVSLSSITVKLPPPPFAVGTKQQIQATGVFSDQSKQTLTSLVTWSSSSPRVATMDTLGRATALKAGRSE